MNIGSDFQFLDYGLDLYAPQSTTDRDGRRVVIAWLRMPEPADDNTIGMFSMPRVCEVKEGHIFFRPHPSVRARFSRKISAPEGIFMVNQGFLTASRSTSAGMLSEMKTTV